MIELNPTQVILLGSGAAAVVTLLKLAYAQFGDAFLGRKTLTLVLFLVSLALAYLWASPSLPVVPVTGGDPAGVSALWFGYAGELIAVGSVILGFATMIYNFLLQKVFEGLGWTPDRIIAAKK